MEKKTYYQHGYGGVEMFLCAAIIGLVMYFSFYPLKFPETDPQNPVTYFCRPYVEPNGNIKPNAPEIMAPAYDYTPTNLFTLKSVLAPYRLIKASVPVAAYTLKNYFSKDDLRTSTVISDVKCGNESYGGKDHSHFCQWIHPAVKVTPNLGGAYQYAVVFPTSISQEGQIFGTSNMFSEKEGVEKSIKDLYSVSGGTYIPEEGVSVSDEAPVKRLNFGPFHILFLVHLDKEGNWDNPKNDPERTKFPLVDVYQEVQADNHTIPVKPLPKDLINCVDIQGFYLEQGYADKSGINMGPVWESSPDKAQQQLGWFLFEMPPLNGWYQPSCKPAVYLYPKKDTVVNVQVDIPHGFVTYTDPLYPKGGWSVLAKPNGALQYMNSNLSDSRGTVNYPTGIFPYLYYEGKIPDKVVEKPKTGFVKRYEELSAFYDTLLPTLGLNRTEIKEFKTYWLKALPKSPYYFIGLIPQEQLDANEPLTITPKEDTMIRVRLYFEALKESKSVIAPKLQTPQRNGFTVVDWGGMVKADKKHPFTCVQ